MNSVMLLKCDPKSKKQPYGACNFQLTVRVYHACTLWHKHQFLFFNLYYDVTSWIPSFVIFPGEDGCVATT